MAKLPDTIGRLGISAKFLVCTSDVTPSTFNIGNFTKIGSVEVFEEVNNRGSKERYEIDYDNGGEIIERIPELVTRSLVIQKAVLNSQDMLQVFGSSDFNDIIDNDRSFAIAKIEKSPASQNIPLKTTVYTGCWLHNNPKSYDLTRDLKMVQRVDIGYARRFVV